MTTIDLWRYSIVRRANFDDLTLSIPCIECGTPCAHKDVGDAPLHRAVVRYSAGDGEPEFICETCTKKAGAEFVWQITKAVDDVDFLFYGVENSEQLERAADLIDYMTGDITESWRRMAANDL